MSLVLLFVALIFAVAGLGALIDSRPGATGAVVVDRSATAPGLHRQVM